MGIRTAGGRTGLLRWCSRCSAATTSSASSLYRSCVRCGVEAKSTSGGERTPLRLAETCLISEQTGDRPFEEASASSRFRLLSPAQLGHPVGRVDAATTAAAEAGDGWDRSPRQETRAIEEKEWTRSIAPSLRQKEDVPADQNRKSRGPCVVQSRSNNGATAFLVAMCKPASTCGASKSSLTNVNHEDLWASTSPVFEQRCRGRGEVRSMRTLEVGTIRDVRV